MTRRGLQRSCPASPCTAWTSASGWPGSGSPRCGRPWPHGQRERLEAVGVTPLAPAPAAVEQGAPTEPSTAPVSAFEKGVAALAQYKARTSSVTVPRAHVEVLPGGAEVKLGVWVMNQKSRRAKLTADKLATLAALGLEWAADIFDGRAA